MTAEIQKNYVILILSSIIIAVNIIYSIAVILKSKRLLKSKIIIRLYASSLFSWLFLLLSFAVIYSLWYYYGIKLTTAVLSGAVLSGAAHMLIRQYAPKGITEEALFTGARVIFWHNVYDYYIDKKRKAVIFSNNIKGGLTLKGLTRPLKYRIEDEEELEKFLEKRRFVNKIVIR